MAHIIFWNTYTRNKWRLVCSTAVKALPPLRLTNFPLHSHTHATQSCFMLCDIAWLFFFFFFEAQKLTSWFIPSATIGHEVLAEFEFPQKGLWSWENSLRLDGHLGSLVCFNKQTCKKKEKKKGSFRFACLESDGAEWWTIAVHLQLHSRVEP